MKRRPHIVIAICLALTTGCTPPPAPLPLPAPLVQRPDAEPMRGPTVAAIPATRRGAALIIAHVEPVLMLYPPPAASGGAGTVVILSPLRNRSQPLPPLRETDNLQSTGTDIEEFARALRHYCHHWALADDLNILVDAHIIEPGSDNAAACAQEE